MTLKTAKIFMNGRSQAVRLPKEFRFQAHEVTLYKQGQCVVLCPKTSTWRDFFEQTPLPSDDFMTERGDSAPQDREDLF